MIHRLQHLLIQSNAFVCAKASAEGKGHNNATPNANAM
jgi:hypothetical protein